MTYMSKSKTLYITLMVTTIYALVNKIVPPLFYGHDPYREMAVYTEIMRTKHLPVEVPPMLDYIVQFPVLHVLSALFSYATSLNHIYVGKYLPITFFVVSVLLTYLILREIHNLSGNNIERLLLSLPLIITLTASIIRSNIVYHSIFIREAIAYAIALLSIYINLKIIIRKSVTRKDLLILALSWITVVMSHHLTALLAFLFILNVYVWLGNDVLRNNVVKNTLVFIGILILVKWIYLYMTTSPLLLIATLLERAPVSIRGVTLPTTIRYRYMAILTALNILVYLIPLAIWFFKKITIQKMIAPLFGLSMYALSIILFAYLPTKSLVPDRFEPWGYIYSSIVLIYALSRINRKIARNIVIVILVVTLIASTYRIPLGLLGYNTEVYFVTSREYHLYNFVVEHHCSIYKDQYYFLTLYIEILRNITISPNVIENCLVTLEYDNNNSLISVIQRVKTNNNTFRNIVYSS